MKKSYKYIMLLIICICLVGCGTKEDSNRMYSKINKLDDYLYEIDYKDYKYDSNLETVISVEDFSCSSVKNGNFYGRNFDFLYNDVVEFVVKVNKKGNRHASVGVATISGIHKDDDIEKLTDKLELLPNATLDGINDSGVIISDNVVPKEDVLPLTGTNPGKEDLHIALVVRYILDNASSADEAIKLLEERNIYGDLGEHYYLHFMIADKTKTYVVEFIDNKLVAQEKAGNNQVMTNYYVNLDELTENSAGVERFNILKENYNEGSSFEGMWNLLQKVKYSKVYLFDKEVEWHSEFVPQSIIKSGNVKKFLEEYDIDSLRKNYWIARAYNDRNTGNSMYWQTVHNSTYDIENRKLRVTIQENYNKYYEFNLK